MKLKQSKGFVIVASKKVAFYYSAMNLIDSILVEYPDAQFALFTEKRFLDERAEDPNIQVFDCEDHIRSKLYGMANSPFDLTMYIDADQECQHEDIITIWDQIGDDDMKFVELTKDEVAQKGFVEVTAPIPSTGDMIDLVLCGGVCLYNMKNPLVKDFMQDWWDMFVIQEEWYQHSRGRRAEPKSERWYPEDTPHSMLRWDQFTLWWLTNKIPKYKDIKIGIFKENYRWNWFSSFGFDSNGNYRLVDKEPILIHHSSTMNKDLRL
jgi:hypothetical protein